MAWVTNLPPLGNFVTHAARNDRGRLTLSLGDSNHARGKRATALRAPTSPHSPQSNSRPHRAEQPPWKPQLDAARLAAQRAECERIDVRALLQPRIAVVVVAVALPEARLVVVEQLDRLQVLRRLPEVALGHQETYRPAVLV